ncbi:MAG: hypothetical protein DRJ56_00610 [Thermoprotei archaeon]|nr:MAG: hypothetical protein DRJ56_00610 [Thermoprotei archaeon]
MILGVVSPRLDEERLSQFVDLVAGEDLVVELNLSDRRQFIEASPVSLVEFSDYLDELSVGLLRIPPLDLGLVDELDRAIMVADDLGARAIVVPYDPESEELARLAVDSTYDALLEYDETLCFEPRKAVRGLVDHVRALMEALEDEYSPLPVMLSYDVWSLEGSLADLLDLMEYVGVIHACAVSAEGRRPIFSQPSQLNPYELLDLLVEVNYVGYFVLHYDEKFMDAYVGDANRVKEYVLSRFERG